MVDLLTRARQWLSEVRGVDEAIRMRNAVLLVTELSDDLAAVTLERDKANAEADRYCSLYVDFKKQAESALLAVPPPQEAPMKLRTASESVGWLNSVGPLNVAPECASKDSPPVGVAATGMMTERMLSAAELAERLFAKTPHPIDAEPDPDPFQCARFVPPDDEFCQSCGRHVDDHPEAARAVPREPDPPQEN